MFSLSWRVWIFLIITTLTMYDLIAALNPKLLVIRKNTRIALTCNILCCTEAHVIHIYFDNNSTSDTTQDLLTCLSKSKAPPVFVRPLGQKFRSRPLHFISVHVFIIPRSIVEVVKRMTRSIRKRRAKKKYMKYVFIFEEFVDAGSDTLIRLFENLWSKNVLNAISVYETHRLNVFSFDPFVGDGSGGIAVVDISNQMCTNLFYEKVVNLNGRPIRISMFNDSIRAIPDTEKDGYRGVDGYIAQTIVERLNATANYILPSDGLTYGRFENGTLTGSLGDVAFYRVDMSLNSRFALSSFTTEELEHTSSYERVKLCVVVPKSDLSPIIYNIFRTLSGESWLAMIVVFFIVLILILFIQIAQVNIFAKKHPFRKYDVSDMFQILFQSFFGDSLQNVTKSTPIRCILAAWLIYSHLSTSLFTGKLESTLVLPKYEEDLDQLVELQNRSIEIGVVQGFLPPIISSLDTDTWNYIKPKLKITEINIFDQMAINHRKPATSAYILRDDKAKYFVAQNFDQATGRSTFHIMDECLAFLPRGYIVNKGSPFLAKIDNLLSLFFESGLIQYWQTITEFEAITSGRFIKDEEAYREDDEEDDDNSSRIIREIFTLSHLQGAFYLWIFGIGLSGVSFIIEIIYYHWQRRSHFRNAKITDAS